MVAFSTPRSQKKAKNIYLTKEYFNITILDEYVKLTNDRSFLYVEMPLACWNSFFDYNNFPLIPLVDLQTQLFLLQKRNCCITIILTYYYYYYY